jgi:predicted nucleic acid-binding protein
VVLSRVFDTNAILYLLGGKLAQPLPADQYFISVISVISETELLSYPLLEASAQAKIEGFLSEVTVVALGDEVKKIAIRLRREHQIKLPDAIVAATALSLGAPLLTNDIKLRRIPGLSCQELKLK